MPQERALKTGLEQMITADRKLAVRIQLFVWPAMLAALVVLSLVTDRNADYVMLWVCAFFNALSSTIFLITVLCRLAAWIWFGRKHFRETGKTRIVPRRPLMQKKKMVGNFIFILSTEAALALITACFIKTGMLVTLLVYVVPIIPLCILYRHLSKAAAFQETAQAIPQQAAKPGKPIGEGRHLFILLTVCFLLSIVLFVIEFRTDQDPEQLYAIVQMGLLSGYCVIVPLVRRKTQNKYYGKLFEDLSD